MLSLTLLASLLMVDGALSQPQYHGLPHRSNALTRRDAEWDTTLNEAEAPRLERRLAPWTGPLMAYKAVQMIRQGSAERRVKNALEKGAPLAHQHSRDSKEAADMRTALLAEKNGKRGSHKSRRKLEKQMKTFKVNKKGKLVRKKRHHVVKAFVAAAAIIGAGGLAAGSYEAYRADHPKQGGDTANQAGSPNQGSSGQGAGGNSNNNGGQNHGQLNKQPAQHPTVSPSPSGADDPQGDSPDTGPGSGPPPHSPSPQADPPSGPSTPGSTSPQAPGGPPPREPSGSDPEQPPSGPTPPSPPSGHPPASPGAPAGPGSGSPPYPPSSPPAGKPAPPGPGGPGGSGGSGGPAAPSPQGMAGMPVTSNPNAPATPQQIAQTRQMMGSVLPPGGPSL